MRQTLTYFAELFKDPLFNFFQKDIQMPTVSAHAFLTRESLPEILEFIEVYDYDTQEKMLDIVISKNPRIRQFFQLYFNHTFSELGDVDYEMPKATQPGISNLYRQLREIQTLAEDFIWPIEKKRQQFKVIASSLSVEELMVLENTIAHTLEKMYEQLNWDYLKGKYQLKRIDEVVTIVDPTSIES